MPDDQRQPHCLMRVECDWRTNQDWDPYKIESFGLTRREVDLLLSCLNGLNPPPAGYSPTSLAAEVRNASAEAVIDIPEEGVDLNFPPNPSAENPHEYIDVAEKIEKLPAAAVARIEGYVLGYWQAVAHRDEPPGG